MGRYRPRSLAFGLLVLVLVAVLWSQGASGSAAAPDRVLRGDVRASGVADDPSGWRVSRTDVGVYHLVVPGGPAVVDVTTWSVPADVRIVPLGRATSEIRFTVDDEPVDAAFEVRIRMAP